jgi:hypothetical protein
MPCPVMCCGPGGGAVNGDLDFFRLLNTAPTLELLVFLRSLRVDLQLFSPGLFEYPAVVSF